MSSVCDALLTVSRMMWCKSVGIVAVGVFLSSRAGDFSSSPLPAQLLPFLPLPTPPGPRISSTRPLTLAPTSLDLFPSLVFALPTSLTIMFGENSSPSIALLSTRLLRGPCVSGNGGNKETHGAALAMFSQAPLFHHLEGSMFSKRSAHDIFPGLHVMLILEVCPLFFFALALLPLLPVLILIIVLPPPWDDACAEAVKQVILLAT